MVSRTVDDSKREERERKGKEDVTNFSLLFTLGSLGGSESENSLLSAVLLLLRRTRRLLSTSLLTVIILYSLLR